MTVHTTVAVLEKASVIAARAAGLVQRRAAYLIEQMLDHGPDAHDLGPLLDEVGGVGDLFVVAGRFIHPDAVLGDHDDPLRLVAVVGGALLLILRGVQAALLSSGRSSHVKPGATPA